MIVDERYTWSPILAFGFWNEPRRRRLVEAPEAPEGFRRVGSLHLRLVVVRSGDVAVNVFEGDPDIGWTDTFDALVEIPFPEEPGRWNAVETYWRDLSTDAWGWLERRFAKTLYEPAFSTESRFLSAEREFEVRLVATLLETDGRGRKIELARLEKKSPRLRTCARIVAGN